MTPPVVQSSSTQIMRFVPIILCLAAFVIGAFVTKPLYETRLALKDQISLLNSQTTQQETKRSALKRLESLATTAEMQEKFLRYAQPFREDTVFESVFALAKNANLEIESISISKGSRLPSGFSQATVSFNVAFDSVNKLKRFIRDLSAQKDANRALPQRAFMINTLSYPYGATDWQEISFPIDLSMYYLDV